MTQSSMNSFRNFGVTSRVRRNRPNNMRIVCVPKGRPALFP